MTDKRRKLAAEIYFKMNVECCPACDSDNIDAMIAFSDKERATWQPIETAPMNHLPVLVNTEHGQVVAFLDVMWIWWPCPATEPLEWKPTHWMPLPPPPQSIEKVKK